MSEENEVKIEENDEEVVEGTIIDKPEETPTEEVKEVKEDEKPETTEEVVETEETPEEETSTDGLKEVDGETPKERALRATITKLRQEKRDQSTTKIFDTAEEPVKEASSTHQALLDKGYTEEDIANSKEMLKTLAPELGLVDKTQTFQSGANSAVAEFVKENPEYQPINDSDDIRFNHFVGILKSGVYSYQGKSQADLNVIFNKINRDVIDDLGEPVIVNKKGQIAAQNQKVQQVSANTTSSTSVKEPVQKTIDSSVKKVGDNQFTAGGIPMKGFTEEDFK